MTGKIRYDRFFIDIALLPALAQVLDATWPVSEGAAGLESALARICTEATAAIDAGYQFIVLSDRAQGAPRLAPPLRLLLLPRGSSRGGTSISKEPCSTGWVGIIRCRASGCPYFKEQHVQPSSPRELLDGGFAA